MTNPASRKVSRLSRERLKKLLADAQEKIEYLEQSVVTMAQEQRKQELGSEGRGVGLEIRTLPSLRRTQPR